MKKDGRGNHGNHKGGRKPTGRVRTLKLSAKFTKDEREEIISNAKELKMNQSDFLIKCSIFYMANEERKTKQILKLRER